MTKKEMKAQVEQLVAERRPISYKDLCIVWARQHGTNGNVVTWPKRIVSRALNELEAQGLIVVTLPRKEGVA